MVNKRLRNITADKFSFFGAIHIEPELVEESGIKGLHSEETWAINGYILGVTYHAKSIDDLEQIIRLKFRRPDGYEYENEYDIDSVWAEAENDLSCMLHEIAYGREEPEAIK